MDNHVLTPQEGKQLRESYTKHLSILIDTLDQLLEYNGSAYDIVRTALEVQNTAAGLILTYVPKDR